MTHPVLWPKKSFFYPIGNTPPVCFTRHLPPEEGANVLLLACGDPRSILYTVYADHAPKYREMDFTCCDWEPAVLARNILLMTMIVDGVSYHNCWAIFYNFFLDNKSYDTLLQQCRKLILSAPDLQTWKGSKYGTYIKFCTSHTLVAIKRHWEHYLEYSNSSSDAKKSLRSSFSVGMEKIRQRKRGSGSPRSAGPLLLSYTEHARNNYDKFWSTGTILPNQINKMSTPHLNPTFAYCQAGKTFNVHYGTNPFDCFFLAPAYTETQGPQATSSNPYDRAVETAFSQFSSWCLAFKERILSVASSRIVIRFFLGESLAFCRALYSCREHELTDTGVYAFPWGGKQIDLDPEHYGSQSRSAPLTYNVIETSNLADHAGLVNLLVATVPLLHEGFSSVLHTDTLTKPTTAGGSTSGLPRRALADIPTLSLLLGVSPISHLSHFATSCDRHEVLLSSFMSGQFLEKIAWRVPFDPSGNGALSEKLRPAVSDPTCLAKFLFDMYTKMFADENWSANFASLGMDTLNKLAVVHYSRASFACFVAFIRGRLRADWDAAVNHFDLMVTSDRTLLVGPNNYQDMISELYQRGMHKSLIPFQPNFLRSLDDPSGIFAGWKDIPPIVCVVLKVPRAKLKRLEALDPDKIMTPIVQCESRTPGGHNMHSSIQPMFGDLKATFGSAEPKLVIEEDLSAWQGKSPLIVTFYMNTWILLNASSKSVHIGLHIRVSPAVELLMPILGPELTIFSTDLSDKNHLFVVRDRPGNFGEIERLRKSTTLHIPKDAETAQRASLMFEQSGRAVMHMCIREEITEGRLAKNLATGASVASQPVSDYTVDVAFDGYSKRLVYPFPIKVGQIKTRIARKSSYIEVEAPVRTNFQDTFDVSLHPFPVLIQEGQLTLTNAHYINLDKLPAMKFPIPRANLTWLYTHVALSLSETERDLQNNVARKNKGDVIGIKQSIGTVFYNYSGVETQERRKVFGLYSPSHGVGLYLLIFVNDIKLDLSSHTVVADACVISLHEHVLDKILPVMSKLMALPVYQFETNHGETLLWKKLLPVFAERCRTWEHTPNCEYITNGVPAALEGYAASPLCSCGKGKDLGAFGNLQQWKVLHSEAIRVAICPLFPSSTAEQAMFNKFTEMMNSDAPNSSAPGPSVSRCANCGKPGNPTLQVCSSCKAVKYCSKSCQKAHWKIHKPQCGAS
ncbi:hypothetical protein CPC08DRAFT_633992 [Agrocybe pediades]|nr:hypothetical protein CPC08DRAFT_633992 [Agrocybe pediades]